MKIIFEATKQFFDIPFVLSFSRMKKMTWHMFIQYETYVECMWISLLCYGYT